LDAGEYLEAIDDFTNATESKDFIAQAYEGRSIAFTNLGKIYEAKADIAKAKFFQEEQKHSKKNSHG
jgi:Flp pilus assembly protein TadD